LITNIEQKVGAPAEEVPLTKGIKAQVALKKSGQEISESFFKKYDFNYHHSLNLPVHTNFTLHLTSSLQSKHDFGFYTVSPALSFHTAQSFYRV
jgi:hypothetical protein